jgi:hypothetical protein
LEKLYEQTAVDSTSSVTLTDNVEVVTNRHDMLRRWKEIAKIEGAKKNNLKTLYTIYNTLVNTTIISNMIQSRVTIYIDFAR